MNETPASLPPKEIKSTIPTFAKKFEFTNKETSQKHEITLNYFFDRDKYGLRISIQTEVGIEIGFLAVGFETGNSRITSINKALDKRLLPYEMREISGIMTAAQSYMNEQLVKENVQEIATKIPKERVSSILSRLRARNANGEHPLTTVIDEGNYYLVTTYLNKTMSQEAVDSLTNQLVSKN